MERRIIALRVTRRWGPHRIGYHLRIPRSTVGRVLGRYAMMRRSMRVGVRFGLRAGHDDRSVKSSPAR